MIERLTIGLLLAGLLARAGDGDAALTAAGVKEFTAAYASADVAGLAKAAELFKQACDRSPDAARAYYWEGAADFQRAVLLFGSRGSAGHKEVRKALDSALGALTTAVKLNERDAESHALLANAYGISIAVNPLRAPWFGPRAYHHQQSALRYGPDDPRVLYLVGTCQFHGPATLGGKPEAMRHLLKAEELFADEATRPADPLEPRWGRSGCLTFIGQAYDALGKRLDAETYYRKALAVNPQDPLAREGLKQRKP